jgi:GxxExxY protein
MLNLLSCSLFTTEESKRNTTQSKQREMEDNELTGNIIKFGIEVHNALGPGLLESAYKECLFYKMVQAGFMVSKEKPMPLVFEGVKLDCGYRIDLLVENRIVIEIKSVEALSEIHMAQTLTYLKLGGFKLGLLINFNVLKLKDGIKRIINTT